MRVHEEHHPPDLAQHAALGDGLELDVRVEQNALAGRHPRVVLALFTHVDDGEPERPLEGRVSLEHELAANQQERELSVTIGARLAPGGLHLGRAVQPLALLVDGGEHFLEWSALALGGSRGTGLVRMVD